MSYQKDPGIVNWCGPTVVALAADIAYRDALALFARPSARIRGRHFWEMVQALNQAGIQPARGWEYRKPTSGKWSQFGVKWHHPDLPIKWTACEAVTDRPTLAGWLKASWPDRKTHPGDWYWVGITTHYLLIRGRKYFDNATGGQGVFLRSAPHRRARVKFAYRLHRDPSGGMMLAG